MGESAMSGDEVEHWLPVPAWEGFYEVSDKGRVRSVPRLIYVRDGRKRRWPGRVHQPWPDRSGYPSVRMEAQGRRESVAVHVLVRRAFGLETIVDSVPDAGEPERWLPVPGYEGLYEVSDLGRVRSFHFGKGKGKRGGLLRPGRAGANVHLRVVLHKDDKQKCRLIHQLVMEAFVGPRPKGLVVCHGPGGALDNRLSNLSYGSHSKNSGEDRLRDGTLIRGEDIKGSRLTEEAVIECRRRYAAGETTTALAAEFGVNAGTMSEAVTGGTWAHLPGATPRGEKAYYKRGVENSLTKLTPEIAAELRQRWAAGERQYALATEFGVSQSTVWRLIHGKTALSSGH